MSKVKKDTFTKRTFGTKKFHWSIDTKHGDKPKIYIPTVLREDLIA